ncbi:hypothetical protein FH609_004115 [Streptomyces sp. 3MP-14]|uniref:HK97 gp10 family phage protein n=1 Tax=Streptomyces mimosae TaxID=2586635 RepID=A0A5N6A5C7_9ACTN|nr:MULTISPECIES: hypothetical protein [Streptomyces]KAB8162920.1 hypothetical protein FH607_019980 [Streptomyces mimosae]KAB8179133.1 hypothetical protein FH609_004115 [Streptomyces sp. 3MP-14]
MAGGEPPFALRVETHEGLDALVRRIRAEEDGKELRRELAANLRNELKPAAALAKSGIMAMSSAGPGTSPALRSSIAKKIRPEVKLGGRWSGARVKAFKTPGARGFRNAPKRTNRAKGWRHPLFGNRDVWIQQRGREQWFDRALEGRQAQYRRAVLDAMEQMAARIAGRGR